MSTPRYDAIVLGAGFSGLAAGIRLAQFDRKVVVLERHALVGGLNSYYKRAGRRFDTGLHALTNVALRSEKATPLARLLRQLRIDRDVLELREQSFSEIVFPSARLEFGNGFTRLSESVERAFPAERDRFARLVADVRAFDPFAPDLADRSSRVELRERGLDPILADMLLCAACWYGSAEVDDVDWRDFVVLFRSIFLEGFARPAGGVKTLLDVLVKRYRELGGELRTKSGVQRILRDERGARAVVLDDGTVLESDCILSSAGLAETLALAGGTLDERAAPRLSFFETSWITREPQRAVGHEATITFFSRADRFRYGPPRSGELVSLENGVVCCTDNYASDAPPDEGLLRITVPANPRAWFQLDEDAYVAAKARCSDTIAAAAAAIVPDPRPRAVFTDAFTPRTIRKYTGHVDGAVYGSPAKRRDGRTGIENLFVIGTDQGLVGIVGTMLSGVLMANQHALAARSA
ncbi:MAG: NAD(P)/FAD-dependent oxidoreductase [Planctomycetes bacterium]|nr:NAD(P)/FAD-dependent oxidoreductase [Planctomycetota bacterium]